MGERPKLLSVLNAGKVKCLRKEVRRITCCIREEAGYKLR